jgi:molecular chaperone GrpE
MMPNNDQEPLSQEPTAPAAATETVATPAADDAATPSIIIPNAEDGMKKALADAEDRWLRVCAELANLQRRAQKDRDQARRFAVRDVVRALLPVLDNLERAVATSSNVDDPVVSGVRMVCDAIPRALAESGVSVVVPLGGVFDSRFHEAIASEERADVAPGTVLMVQEKGYVLADLLIRPARVVVAAEPRPAEGNA